MRRLIVLVVMAFVAVAAVFAQSAVYGQNGCISTSQRPYITQWSPNVIAYVAEYDDGRIVIDGVNISIAPIHLEWMQKEISLNKELNTVLKRMPFDKVQCMALYDAYKVILDEGDRFRYCDFAYSITSFSIMSNRIMMMQLRTVFPDE